MGWTLAFLTRRQKLVDLNQDDVMGISLEYLVCGQSIAIPSFVGNSRLLEEGTSGCNFDPEGYSFQQAVSKSANGNSDDHASIIENRSTAGPRVNGRCHAELSWGIIHPNSGTHLAGNDTWIAAKSGC